MFVDKRFRLPRLWSNREIRKIAILFKGSVVNVSGWDDRDKEGGCYKQYFSNCTFYHITNYGGERGTGGGSDEIRLDLAKDMPNNLIGKFDVAFNHTTLEHVFDVRKAFSAICGLTKDIVIIVVPFAQTQHETPDFKDFWRFTPSALRALFSENGLKVIYEAESPYANAGAYLLFVGSKYPERWSGIMPPFKPIETAGEWIGENFLNRFCRIIRKFYA